MTTLTSWRPRKTALAAVLALAAWPALASPARADVIDKLLFKEIPSVVEQLQNLKCKNVAVFNFQVQAAKADAGHALGRLRTTLATRLENALIMAYDSERPLGVTRGAGEIAAQRDKGATYRTAAGLEKLFAGTYPLAWGKEQVKADALLTGVASLSPDLAEVTVTLHLYTPGQAKPREVAKVTAPTNRLLLADLGQTFHVRKRELTSRLPLETVDKDAIAAVEFTSTTAKPGARDSFDELLTWDVFYDNKKAKRGPGLVLETPREKQAVHFKMKSKERVGVVLLVNGVNTLNKEADEREPDLYSMWVLEPGEEYVIRGYHTEKGRESFEVLSASASVLSELGNPKRGKVELFVFREAAKPATPAKEPQEKVPGAAVRPLNLRATPRAATPEDLKDAVWQAATTTVSRGIVRPGGVTQPARLDKVTFDGALAGYRIFTYYRDTP